MYVLTSLISRTVRIWLKRDNGRYWPSICQYMSTPPTAFAYNPETRKIFVGTESGLISVSNLLALHAPILLELFIFARFRSLLSPMISIELHN